MYLPEATSGCPKRSEGGFPVGAKEEWEHLRIPAREDGIARSDIRVPEAKRGRVPCRNEGEYRLPSGATKAEPQATAGKN